MSKQLQDEIELLSKPGDTILETLASFKMNQTELAERMGRTAPKINDIISGKEPITINTALQLEKVLGVDAGFWLALETAYREKLSRIEQEEHLEKCLDWVNNQPYKELRKCGYIKTEKKSVELVDDLLKFYGVVSPAQWQTLYVNHYGSASFRKSSAYTPTIGSMAAWLRMGELEMRKQSLKEFEKNNFKEALSEIRNLAVEQPEDFMSQLQQKCISVGVSLVYTICLPKAPVSGATRWIGGTPLIQLTDRYKTNDHFWFTFFHEAGHVLLHGKKEVFLEDFSDYEPDLKKEDEANSFASKWLLPDSFIESLPDDLSLDDIECIAAEFNIHPGIVVGRLQHLGVIPFSFGNALKEKISLFGRN